MKYDQSKDYEPTKDMFEPISVPSKDYLRFPLNIKIEFIVGLSIPVTCNDTQSQPMLKNNQRDIVEKEGSEDCHTQNRQDLWTFPEGSAIIAQNVVPLTTASNVVQNDSSQHILPSNIMPAANKGNLFK